MAHTHAVANTTSLAALGSFPLELALRTQGLCHHLIDVRKGKLLT